MNVFTISMGLLAGLVLFLHGVNILSDSLKKVAGEKMKKLLEKFTTNRFAGVLTGTVATTLLDSSSVTIIMVIALVNAGLLSFSRSLGVIMGSNIGTTISSQIIAFHINEYAPIALVIGFGLHLLAKAKKWRRMGQVVFGIGLVFFGLEIMGKSVEPLQKYQTFIDWMMRLETPILGALVGAVVTVMIQSSSATLGIVITLATQGLITLPAGIAIMLGAEIGTCADTLMATIGRTREAVRAGVFHLLFNILTVIIGVALAHPFTAFVTYISAGADISRQIANAHLLFNVAGVALFIGFVTPIVKLLQHLIPDKEKSRPADTTVKPGVV